MTTIQEIRARLTEQKSTFTPADKSVYPHWNIGQGQSVTLRFLPDGNAGNSFFWVERQMIRLPFNGCINVPDLSESDAAKQYSITIPCLRMYGIKDDPILTEINPLWKTDKNKAKIYWTKKSYLMQGFVYASPFDEDEPPDNPIRRFIINPGIFSLIKSTLMDPEIEDLPTDYVKGLPFKINKTKQGEYDNYSTSCFGRKTDPLTDEQLAAIDQYGLFNLSDFIPTQPSASSQAVIMDMFHESINGQPYNYDRFGEFYTPWGIKMKETSKDDADNDLDTGDGDGKSNEKASRMLDQIKQRQTG